MVEKNIPKWNAVGVQNHQIILVVDPGDPELIPYEDLCENFGLELFVLSAHNKGLGYIRNSILKESKANGEAAHIQADDDYYPTKGSADAFARVVTKFEVVGCGASYSYHGLSLGNEVLKLERADFPLPAPGLGGNVFAIHNGLAHEVGGFPEWATCLGEDHEMVRQSIEYGIPWYYSTRLRISGTARYTDGGHMDLYGTEAKRKKEEARVHQLIHDRWPKYVSRPPKRYRSSWKQMLGDFIPDFDSQIPVRVRKALAAKN